MTRLVLVRGVNLPARDHVVCVSNKTIAEDAGDRSPDRTQRLLIRAGCDASGAVGVVRRVAVAGLDAATRRRGCRRAGKAGRERSPAASRAGAPVIARVRIVIVVASW